MRHEAVTSSAAPKVDWQGLGYLVSIVSVFLLGAVAWPSESEPRWHAWVLIAGVTTSIVGMVMRYKAHLDQKREVRKAKAAAQRR